MKTTRVIAAASMSLAMLVAATARADSLDQIRQRGTLRWGGDRTGGGPYIFEDPDGKLTGFETDMAGFFADRMGVTSKFVNSDWGRLPHLLDRGDIDIVLNGYEWSVEREQQWASTIPYYVYKLQLLTRTKDESIQSWDDLIARPGGSPKRVGVLGGSAAERYLEQFNENIEVRVYPDVARTMQLVRDGQLDATLQDVPIATHYSPEYPELHPIGEPVAPGYYCIFVRRGDRDLRERLNELILQALNDGTFESIYAKYDIWNSDQAELIDVARSWPPEVPPPPSRWAVLPRYAWTLAVAASRTVALTALAMPLAVIIGILVAVGRLYGPRWLDRPLMAYVEFLRGTPVLFQIIVIFFLLPRIGIRLPGFWAGMLGLAINYSAYEAENYRAGLLAIPRGQMEAALSLGMSTWTALRRVIIPQAVRIVMPPVTNDFISLFKDTSVCYVLAVEELSMTYNRLANDHPAVGLELMLVTAILYLMMSYPLSLLARRLERTRQRVNA